MVEVLALLSLTCADYQQLIANANKSQMSAAYKQEVINTLISVARQDLPGNCVFDQTTEVRD